MDIHQEEHCNMLMPKIPLSIVKFHFCVCVARPAHRTDIVAFCGWESAWVKVVALIARETSWWVSVVALEGRVVEGLHTPLPTAD